MNKIKSLFIGMFPMIAMAIIGYGIYQLSTVGTSYIWIGAILTTLPIMLFFSRVMMFKDMARTSAHFPLLTVFAVAGLTLSVYGYKQDIELQGVTESSQIAMVSSGVGFLLFIFYNFWYSTLGRGENKILQVGQEIPEFYVTNTDGAEISSTSFLGTPTVLIFFRGNWCPLCMAQIKEVASKYQELSALGAKVALIAPQPETHTKKLAAKFDVPFIFLTDVGNRAATTLGIVMKNGLPAGMEMLGYDKDTVYPTVIISDAEGKILYSDFTNNYRIRPEPEDFIRVLNNNVQVA